VPRGVRLTLQVVAALVLIGMIGLFARGLIANQTTVYAQMLDGHTPNAPDFTAPLLSGPGSVSLAKLRGKVVVVNFWASWCGGCKDEAPLLNNAQHEYASRGVRIIGVDSNDFSGAARQFARTYHQQYTLVHDSGSIARRWGYGTGFPVTYLVDRKGVVRHLFNGEITGATLDAQLQKILAEPQ
jgi:cytochrome c biogenesis protein CcmG, thiol:disulfide interchange protein DsbE